MPFASATVDLSAPQIIGLIVAAVGGFVSLVYWLVRLSFKRQSEITDRYFAHLEKKDAEQQETLKMFGDSMQAIGRNMNEQTVILQKLHDRAACRFPGKDGR